MDILGHGFYFQCSVTKGQCCKTPLALPAGMPVRIASVRLVSYHAHYSSLGYTILVVLSPD